MIQAKEFRVVGMIKKAVAKIPFTIQLRALKAEDAIEKIYAELGSRHKARRFEIKIDKIEELPPEQQTEP